MVDNRNFQVLKWIHAQVDEMVDNRNFPALIHATVRKGQNKVDETVGNRNFQVPKRKGVALFLILILPHFKLVLGLKKRPN